MQIIANILGQGVLIVVVIESISYAGELSEGFCESSAFVAAAVHVYEEHDGEREADEEGQEPKGLFFLLVG